MGVCASEWFLLPFLTINEAIFWAVSMFQGTSLLVLDSKGRLSLPSRHRESFLLSKGSEVTLTRHPDGCVLLYPQKQWEELSEKLMQLPYALRAFQRMLLGSAVTVKIDASARLLVPSELRTLCGLSREVTFIGVGNHFELWDQVRYSEYMDREMAKGLPQELESFTL